MRKKKCYPARYHLREIFLYSLIRTLLTKKNMPSDSRYGLKRAMSSKKVCEERLPLEESCEAPGKEQVGMFGRESLCLYVEL